MKLTPIIQKKTRASKAVTLNFTKSGIMSFSQEATRQIPEVSKAKKIVILKDEDRPDDFYLHLITMPAKEEEDHPNLREAGGKRIIANYHCAYLSILEQYKMEKKAIRLPIGESIKVEGKEFWPLITHVLKKQS